MQPQINIVMATYNGAAHLPAQLDSILAQTWQNWRLIVSDDGSTDGTQDVIRRYADRAGPDRIALIDGPRQGATANFLNLVMRAESASWLAFSDQDDVWLPGKLARAAAHLSTCAGPGVYAARTTICDAQLKVLAPAPHFRGPFGFSNALIQACLPGNTTLVNPEALDLLKRAAPAAMNAKVISHDWWVYQILSGAGAHIYRDAAQVLLYRQHDGNVMGRNDTARAKTARAALLFDGTFASWLGRNQIALEASADILTLRNRKALEKFGKLISTNGPSALTHALSLGLYRQNLSGTVAFLTACATGRMRVDLPRPRA